MTISFKQGQKKGIEIAITVDSDVITFVGVKEKETFVNAMVMIWKSSASVVKSFGFSKRDDVEIGTKIHPLRATNVVQTVVPVRIDSVVQKLKEDETLHNLLLLCGFQDFTVSKWITTNNGLQRKCQYVIHMSQNNYAEAIVSLVRSGQSCALQVTEMFRRMAEEPFVQCQLQGYFVESGESVKFRGAYEVKWIRETWDKEFVEASLDRKNRMMFYCLESQFTNKKFDKAKYEGKWLQHQPYVLVILVLVTSIILTIFAPEDTNWYKILAGLVAVALLIYV